MAPTGGLLISFDGTDSSGKETQSNLLIRRLREAGHRVKKFTTPDYTTPTGQRLKALFQSTKGSWNDLTWQEQMTLIAANRAEHRHEVVQLLSACAIVVYDRYIPSSLTHMAIDALAPAEIAPRRGEITAAVENYEYGEMQMPKENVSIFLDMPPTIAQKLLAERKAKLGEADEVTDQLGVQQRLYNEYDWHARENPQRFARIQCVTENGTLRSAEEISELVWRELIKRFPTLTKD